jgi:hypothetical protein
MCDPSYVAWNVAFFTANSKWKSRTLQIWTKPYEEGWYLSTSGSRNAIRQGRAQSQLGWLGVVHVPTFRKWLDRSFRPLPNVPVETAGAEVKKQYRTPRDVPGPAVAIVTPPPTPPANAPEAVQEKPVRLDAGTQPSPGPAVRTTSASLSPLPEPPTPNRVVAAPAKPPEMSKPEGTPQKPAPAKSIITIRPIQAAQEATPAPEVPQNTAKKVPSVGRTEDAKNLAPARSSAGEKQRKAKQKKSAADDGEGDDANPFGTATKSEGWEDPFTPP